MKRHQWMLIGITGVFLCLLIGIFVGRNFTNATIPVNKVVNSDSNPNTVGNQNGIVKIDINTASIQQLQLLPGIGESLAQRIVDYRSTYGAFISVTELLNVTGIGEKKFEQIKPYIEVGGNYENSDS